MKPAQMPVNVKHAETVRTAGPDRRRASLALGQTQQASEAVPSNIGTLIPGNPRAFQKAQRPSRVPGGHPRSEQQSPVSETP